MAKKKKRETVEERTHKAEVAIDNALAIEEILNTLTQFGYNKVELEKGKKYQLKVVDLIVKQKSEYGDQFEATKELNDAWIIARETYMNSLKIARVAFKKDEKANAALVLSGDRKDSLSGFIIQSHLFYDNLLANQRLFLKMKRFGYTKAKLQQEMKLVKALIKLNKKQETEKGDAREATQKRDAVIDKLDTWMSDFKAIAKVALADNPKWLNKLGFREDK